MDTSQQSQDFEEVKARLDEIVAAVSDDDLPLDDALDLYEEAVSLGLRVSDLLEEGIALPEGEGGDGSPEMAEGLSGDQSVAQPAAVGASAQEAVSPASDDVE